jgi:hypothetical protein
MHPTNLALIVSGCGGYRTTGNARRPEAIRDAGTIALPCHRSGAGWLALVRQASGVRNWRSSMSAVLRDLRVGQWIYADSLGKPASGGLMGKIICLPWTKDQQVVVAEVADDDPVVVEAGEIEFVADSQEQLQEQLWQVRVST